MLSVNLLQKIYLLRKYEMLLTQHVLSHRCPGIFTQKSYLVNNVMEMAFDTTRKLSLPWPDAAARGIL